MANPFEQQRPIEGVKKIIAISSGKGGVGKSTISCNLALSLVKAGYKVGLLDADIYGPSIPRMFGSLNQRPSVTSQQRIEPLVRYGLKLMSMGFLIEENSAVVWRGPMLFKAMEQFFRDVEWGELDFMLIDLPPGTGDVQLSIAQKVPVNGAIAICTPQNVALADVKKSLDMFKRVNVPVFGLIENMAYFRAPGTNEKMTLFPRGELEKYMDFEKIEKLGEIPFFTPVAEGAEIGIPIVESKPEDPISQTFANIAKKIVEKCS